MDREMKGRGVEGISSPQLFYLAPPMLFVDIIPSVSAEKNMNSHRLNWLSNIITRY